MLNRFRQTGAFILVTLVFLMVAGGAMLYAMSNLSSVSNTTTTLAHNGNMALAAAQSGLKYCLYELDIRACTPVPAITPTLPAPCNITTSVAPATCNTDAAPLLCTITSTAYCPSLTDTSTGQVVSYRGAKKLSIQVRKTTGGYQIIPASRLVLPVP